MYSKILIAIDGSSLSTKGLKHGLRLANAMDASVAVVHVTEMWSSIEMVHKSNPQQGIAHYEEQADRHAQAILNEAQTHATEMGIDCELIHIRDEAPSKGIIQAAKRQGSNLIVMSSHGRRGLNRTFLGSQCYEVITLSTVPVLVVR